MNQELQYRTLRWHHRAMQVLHPARHRWRDQDDPAGDDDPSASLAEGMLAAIAKE